MSEARKLLVELVNNFHDYVGQTVAGQDFIDRVRAELRVAAGAGDPTSRLGDRPPAPSEAAQRFDAIMVRVREEQRAGRTPEQELRDALTAIRPLIERDDVEDEEWVAAFEKEVPILVDAAYRFLGAVRPPPRAAPREPSAAAIAAAWDANARCGMYAASKEGIAAALRAAYEIDCGASPAAAPPQEEP